MKIGRENRKGKLKYFGFKIHIFLWLPGGLKETVLFWYCTRAAKGTAN